MNKTITNGSIAHTVGNVTTLFTEFLKSLFPDSFFQYVHVATRMAYREQKQEENSDYEFIKKRKPILIIRPKIDINNTDIFLTYSLFTTNLFGADLTLNESNMQPFFLDREAQCQINYMLNRIRVVFECTMMFDTEFEQINQYAYFLNLFTQERVYRMNTALEFYIPPSIMELVSAYSGVPIKDNDHGTTKHFLDYFMQHSNKYVTIKERTSSSTIDFFMFYPLSIDYVFTDITKDDPNKKDWASDSCNINFTLTTEFNTVAIYDFATKQKKNVEILGEVSIGPKKRRPIDNGGINIIPYFTIGNLFEHTKMENGYELFYTQAFETDETIHEDEDYLDLEPVFRDTNAMDIIKWHNKQGVPNSVFLQFIIMRNNDKLIEGTDFIVDWENFKLRILKADPDKTYRLNIFVNNLYVTHLMENFNNESSTYEQQVGRVTDKTINLKRDNEIGIK